MKFFVLAFSFLALVSTVSIANAADLSSFEAAKTAFVNGRAPTATELVNALWMATSIASDPKIKGAQSGNYPDGRIPDQKDFYREIARFDVERDTEGLTVVTAKFGLTEADTGIDLGTTVHTGSLLKKELVLVAAGDAQTCSTRTTCRLIDAKELVCAQANDDSRAQCTRSYKKGAISSYIGYKAVHP